MSKNIVEEECVSLTEQSEAIEQEDDYIKNVVSIIKKSCSILIDFGVKKLFEDKKEETEDGEV